jgi:hypothetical protein
MPHSILYNPDNEELRFTTEKERYEVLDNM